MKDNLAALGKLFWQFEIAGVPLPRLTVQGKVGRREGEWWLKVWGERLLFCAADAPGRVFAVVTPCENEPNLAEFWRAAVKCGDYGRLIVQEARLAQPLETKSAFATIYSQNGAQWTREWCGGPWFEGARRVLRRLQFGIVIGENRAFRFSCPNGLKRYGLARFLLTNAVDKMWFGYAVLAPSGSVYAKPARPLTSLTIA